MNNAFIIDTRQRIDQRLGKGPRVYKDVSMTVSASIFKEPPYVVEVISDKSAKESDTMTNIERNEERPVNTQPFRYVSLFSGIGGFEQALNTLGGECVLASEIDKFANQSYEALYGAPTAGDITAIEADDVPDHDVLVGGFPCQAFSVAGKRLGFDDTRGTLFFEVARIANAKKPRAILLENVKGLVGHDKGRTLDAIVRTLNEIGYHVDYNVLNSKYFGVPQNRERIFIVALRDDLVKPSAWQPEGNGVVAKGKRRIGAYDGVKTFNFDWPAQESVTTRLRDVLEPAVDERYYLSEDKTAKLVAQLEAQSPSVTDEIRCYNPRDVETGSQTRMQDRVYDANGNAVALTSFCDRLNVLDSPQMLGHIDIKGHDAVKRVYSADHVGPTLTTMGGGHREPKTAVSDGVRYRIRKLSPLECFRLQGFSDEAHQTLVDAGLSESQRYKQAGNAVSVPVIRAIGERLLPLI